MNRMKYQAFCSDEEWPSQSSEPLPQQDSSNHLQSCWKPTKVILRCSFVLFLIIIVCTVVTTVIILPSTRISTRSIRHPELSIHNTTSAASPSDDTISQPPSLYLPKTFVPTQWKRPSQSSQNTLYSNTKTPCSVSIPPVTFKPFTRTSQTNVPSKRTRRPSYISNRPSPRVTKYPSKAPNRL